MNTPFQPVLHRAWRAYVAVAVAVAVTMTVAVAVTFQQATSERSRASNTSNMYLVEGPIPVEGA